MGEIERARKGGNGKRGKDRGEREEEEREFSSMMEHRVYVYPRVVGQHKLDTIGLRETKRTIEKECKNVKVGG